MASLHCPICAGYLGDLEKKLGDFEDKGVPVIAISSDVEARAAEAKEKWGFSFHRRLSVVSPSPSHRFAAGPVLSRGARG